LSEKTNHTIHIGLRGFEDGRVGPKDGDDFVVGNYAYSINFASNIPQSF
jgi:outer membrane protein insertion porin family